jgi:hypothetical protein
MQKLVNSNDVWNQAFPQVGDRNLPLLLLLLRQRQRRRRRLLLQMTSDAMRSGTRPSPRCATEIRCCCC